VEHLKSRQRRKQQPLSGQTLRHHINALSNLNERAKSENLVVGSYNPVQNIMKGEKPTGKAAEARWLEVDEAAHLLETARTFKSFKSKRADISCPFLYPLLATFLLTGGRKSEVLGLEAEDISFTRHT
jgi:integrase